VEVTVGIDIGTTSVKALAADGDGRVVASVRMPHRLLVPAADHLEHDAEKVWRRAPLRALQALGRSDARGVSVVGLVPSLTAVDERGRPRTPGLLYGDGRGRHGGARHDAEGFLRWTASALPGARGYWPAQAVANHALSGEAAIDTGVAASSSPVFDLETWKWSEEVIAGAGAGLAQLPRVEGMGRAVGRVGDAVLDSGGVDAMAELLAAGTTQEGDVLVLLGTTLIVWAVSSEWREVAGLDTFPHVGASGMTLIGGPSNAGGLFLDWALRLLGRPRGPVDPDAVPVWSPWPRGERAPVQDPSPRAGLHGLDLSHGPAAACRAAFEASGFVARRLIGLTGVNARRVVVTGGGTAVEGWVQALADAAALPCQVVAVPEGAALGAAFLARMAAGLEASTAGAARWARTARTVEPDPRWAPPVAARYRRFLDLCPT
jgi:xylulokinase